MENPLLSLLEPWCEFVPGQADAFLREIQVELSPGHPLYGVKLTALAHSGRADDALFKLDDGRVADVQLTWSGHAEQPPWPGHQVHKTLDDWVQQVMIPAHQDR